MESVGFETAATVVNDAQNRTPPPIRISPARAQPASPVFVVHGFYSEWPDHYRWWRLSLRRPSLTPGCTEFSLAALSTMAPFLCFAKALAGATVRTNELFIHNKIKSKPHRFCREDDGDEELGVTVGDIVVVF
uniref:Uncharacterized protein n=1 Tax=Romanomermis culicivorax TaxID=13658 RepID=A0A915JNS6_ROMCU